MRRMGIVWVCCLVASCDTAISAKGPLNTSGSLGYRAMLGAGLEFGNETGDGRKLMGALTWSDDRTSGSGRQPLIPTSNVL